MTIIIGAVFSNAVAIAADSLRSSDDGERQRVFKVRQIGNRVCVAKGGYGDLSDVVWENITALPDEIKQNPLHLADEIERLGKPVYDDCRNRADDAGVDDFGLFLMVAGLMPDGSGVVIALDIGNNKRKIHYGSEGSKVSALGSIADPLGIATRTANAISSDGGPLDVRRWTLAAVREGIRCDGETIAFPADGFIVTGNGLETFTVSDSDVKLEVP